MNSKNIKCSSKNHLEINAICFCQECRLYMCDKCKTFHSDLFVTHHELNLDNLENDINEFFNGTCQEENHPMILEFSPSLSRCLTALTTSIFVSP